MGQTNSSKSNLALQKISYYVVLAVLIFIFLSSAYMKLSNNETIINNFSKWNLLNWKNIIAAVEITGAVLLVFRKTNIFGCLLLSGVMAGAIFTHLQHNEPYYFPLAILIVIWISFFFIRPKKTGI